jgi:hypothetical protein
LDIDPPVEENVWLLFENPEKTKDGIGWVFVIIMSVYRGCEGEEPLCLKIRLLVKQSQNQPLLISYIFYSP